MGYKYLYHATFKENLGAIMSEGILAGWDGLVYTCTEQEDAVKFIALRAVLQNKDIVVIEIKAERLDKSKIEDGMDHSPEFFKGCIVKTYPKHIPVGALGVYYDYRRRE